MRFLCIFLLGLVISGCAKQRPETVEPVTRVKTFEVGDRAQGQVRRISGKLVAADRSVLSFAVAGTIRDVNVSAGDTVATGQLLASLEKRPFELAVQNARAQLNIARSTLNEKQRRHARLKQLFEQQMISPSELDVAEVELSTARNNLQSAQASLENAERDLGDTALSAPFPGQLAERNIEPFQEINAGEKAFVLDSKGNLEAQVLVPETLIRDVDYGQTVQVSFPTLKDTQVAGIVTQIGAQVQAGNAFPVKVQLSASAADLRPGMTAAVTFNFNAYLSDRTVFLIPLSAIAIDAGLLARYDNEQPPSDLQAAPVYVFDETTSTVKLRNVKIGNLRGNLLEVYEGLEAGDEVVTAGVAFLRNDMPARRWDARQGLIE